MTDWSVEFDLGGGVRVGFWDEDCEVPLAVFVGGKKGGEVGG